jgi:hypothetical protein
MDPVRVFVVACSVPVIVCVFFQLLRVNRDLKKLEGALLDEARKTTPRTG